MNVLAGTHQFIVYVPYCRTADALLVVFTILTFMSALFQRVVGTYWVLMDLPVFRVV